METVEASDVVITMGCGDACPVFAGKRYEDWDLEIQARIHALIGEPGIPISLEDQAREDHTCRSHPCRTT